MPKFTLNFHGNLLAYLQQCFENRAVPKVYTTSKNLDEHMNSLNNRGTALRVMEVTDHYVVLAEKPDSGPSFIVAMSAIVGYGFGA